ncbi:glycosyl transferase [Brucella intermedia]|nr:glycosyl transferase [Brucella intermedia]RQP19300.1 MAG: glycosyltransferase family 2 protein [Brucella intermedia]
MKILTVCVVIYNPDREELYKTFSGLQVATQNVARDISLRLLIVDNSDTVSIDTHFHPILAEIPTKIVQGQGNVGFARANNYALAEGVGDFHLVLNPDVEMSAFALQAAVEFMSTHPECGLLTPSASYPSGSKQYLCKQYPSVFDLFLRGFAPRFIRNLFTTELARYEMRNKTNNTIYWDPPIVSGCFMFFRGNTFCAIRGFDERYMLYFEDFDISIRASQTTRIAYVPTVQIVHSGGNAARKGWWHIKQFGRSAALFFLSHGIKLF